MAYSLENRLIIGISTRALFDLRTENRIFEEEGVDMEGADEEEILNADEVNVTLSFVSASFLKIFNEYSYFFLNSFYVFFNRFNCIHYIFIFC